MPILNLRLDSDLDRRLTEVARREERTASRQAVVLLRQALGLRAANGEIVGDNGGSEAVQCSDR